LGQLGTIDKELTELGYQIIAISPDKPEKIRTLTANADYNYQLVSDSRLEMAKAFGIAFQLTDEQVAQLNRYKLDIVEASGETHKQLPVPAVYIVNKKGKILFSYVNPQYSVRLEPSVIVAAARAMK
jgi:peroxiredoxin